MNLSVGKIPVSLHVKPRGKVAVGIILLDFPLQKLLAHIASASVDIYTFVTALCFSFHRSCDVQRGLNILCVHYRDLDKKLIHKYI